MCYVIHHISLFITYLVIMCYYVIQHISLRITYLVIMSYFDNIIYLQKLTRLHVKWCSDKLACNWFK